MEKKTSIDFPYTQRNWAQIRYLFSVYARTDDNLLLPME